MLDLNRLLKSRAGPDENVQVDNILWLCLALHKTPEEVLKDVKIPQYFVMAERLPTVMGRMVNGSS